MNDEPKNLPQEAGDDARLPGHADPAPDGEEPYRVAKTRGHEYTMVWTVVGPAIVGGRIYDDENTAAVDCEDLTAAYSHGFTAGQKCRTEPHPRWTVNDPDGPLAGAHRQIEKRQTVWAGLPFINAETARIIINDLAEALTFAAAERGHSDRAEPGVTESLERLLDGRANDETIDVCSVWNAIHEGQQSAAYRREGEPRVMFSDQEPSAQTWTDDDCVDISSDLVAAARAALEHMESERPTHSDSFVVCKLRTALENTPQPDESEAVRSMIHAAQNYAALPIENTEQARARRFQLVEAINLLAYIAPRLTSRDTPEVDNIDRFLPAGDGVIDCETGHHVSDYDSETLMDFLNALASSPSQPEGWLPIDSAPKDGTRVVGLMPGKSPQTMWWNGYDFEIDADINDSWLPEIWIPIPAAPTNSKEQQA